jgi:AcrR family transcriptional regulator
MARPAETDKRLDLARRAVAILQREGLELSAAQLAERLGVKRPTLLYHFPSYAPIFETVLQESLAEQALFVMAQVEEHEHPIDRLYAQLRAVHEFHRGREERILFLTQAIAATGGTRARAIVEAGSQVFEAYRRAAADRIREGIAQGLVAPCDADALVALMRAINDGLMIQRVFGGLALEPVHELVWERLLLPLKLEAASAARSPRGRTAPKRNARALRAQNEGRARAARRR